ncbi:MAG: sugar transferase, partial [Eggerthellaceae bacterium]|nr:sugar transferase [Eggerthellaceae bacterium]
MYRNSEEQLTDLLDENEQTGPAFKIKNDPRITRVGRFIRKYSIDELPQLVNIIKGDMSIVGPRAIQKTQEFTPYEAQRELVQPGLTCYWQISGRADISWEEWVELD